MRVLEAANSSLRTVGLLFGLVIAFGLSLGIGLTATGVLASHEGDDTIHACVNPFSKVARIVEDPARCA